MCRGTILLTIGGGCRWKTFLRSCSSYSPFPRQPIDRALDYSTRACQTLGDDHSLAFVTSARSTLHRRRHRRLFSSLFRKRAEAITAKSTAPFTISERTRSLEIRGNDDTPKRVSLRLLVLSRNVVRSSRPPRIPIPRGSCFLRATRYVTGRATVREIVAIELADNLSGPIYPASERGSFPRCSTRITVTRYAPRFLP